MTQPSIATATQATGAVTITPPVATLSFSPAAGLAFSGTQPMQTLSSPLSLTITDTGTGPLQVSSLTFAGADSQDFLISSNGCMGQVAAGASCTLDVSFAPQGQGARSASLQIASNAQGSPASVPLSGTGGSLPQGPQGPGRDRPGGQSWQIELVVCQKVKKHGKTTQHCTAKLVTGPVKFTTARDTDSATVARAGVTYASGIAIRTGAGRWQLVLRDRRVLRAGRYTLTLRSGHRVTERRSIVIS